MYKKKKEVFMNIYEKSHKLSDGEFKRLIGVQRETFEEMLKILQKLLSRNKKNRETHPVLFGIVNNPYIVQNPLYGKCYKAAFRAKKLIFSYLIKKLHAKSRIPKKALKKRPLTKVEKSENRLLSIECILIEKYECKD